MPDWHAQTIGEAQRYLEQIGDSVLTHTRSVTQLALKLAAYYPSVDATLIEVAAWWHDTGRLFDRDHEVLSAQMADASLRSLGVDADARRTVYDAIVFHKWSMNPETIEGEIIRDADKLDWVSVSRWDTLINEGNTGALKNFADSLERIRNGTLHLEPSRTLFDQMLPELASFVKKIESPELRTIASPLFEYLSRGDHSD